MSRDIDLSEIIDAIENGEYQSEISDKTLKEVIVTSPEETEENQAQQVEAYGIWDRLKEERYAHFSIFISEVWNSFEGVRKTFTPKVKPHDHASTKVRSIRDEMIDTFLNAAKKLKGLKDHQYLNKIYSRYKAIVSFGEKNQILEKNEDEASAIEAGIGTAAITTWGLIELVPLLASQRGIKLTPEQTLNCIRKAYGPIVMLFSSMNLNIATAILDEIIPQGKTHFLTHYFDLVTDGEGEYKLVVDHEKINGLTDKKTGKKIIKMKPHGKTIWCPARFSFGKKKDVVREFFEWCLEVAAKHYLPSVL